MLAVQTMSPTVQAIFFGAAVACFAFVALGVALGRVGLLGLGLMLFAFVFFWQALAAS